MRSCWFRAVCGPFEAYGGSGVDTIGQSIIEIHLRCELKSPMAHGLGANLEVNVHRPAFIPAGVHGQEAGLATRVCDLVATEEFLADSIELGSARPSTPRAHRSARCPLALLPMVDSRRR